MTPARISLGVRARPARSRALVGDRAAASTVSIRRPPRVTTSRRQPSGSASLASRSRRSRARSASRSKSSSIAAAERPRRSRWSSSRKGDAAVELDHLEGAVAAQQAVVEDRDRRLGRAGRSRPSTLASTAVGHRRDPITPSAVYPRPRQWSSSSSPQGWSSSSSWSWSCSAAPIPGSGADLLDWKPTRDYETEFQLEEDDVAQMIAAQNELPAQARRRGADREGRRADGARGPAGPRARPDGRAVAVRDRARAARARAAATNSGPGRVARALLVGCGCRGRELGARLLAEGWAVRGTSRTERGRRRSRRRASRRAIADPDRLGTVLDLVGDVTVVAWLLGSASGEPQAAGGDQRRRGSRACSSSSSTRRSAASSTRRAGASPPRDPRARARGWSRRRRSAGGSRRPDPDADPSDPARVGRGCARTR